MNTGKQRRVIGKPFVKGDVWINRSGRPRSFDQLRLLAQQIGQEKVRDENGALLTVAEMVLRKLVQSNDARALQIFLEYGYGAPPTKIDCETLDTKTVLHLHYGHEEKKVESEQRLLDNGN